MKTNLLKNFIGVSAIVLSLNAQERNVKINEMVVDPQQDYTQDGRITGSDEFFELINYSQDISYNLNGWKLELIDSTPETYFFDNITFFPKSFYVIQNPRGAQNDNGQVKLIDNNGNLVDSVTYGTWEGQNGIFDGSALGIFNESLSRFPDGSMNWIKTYATPNLENVTRQKIKPKLLIEKINDRSKDHIDIQVISFPPAKYTLQRSNDLSNWKSIYTNDIATTSFIFIDSDFKNNQNVFYRAVEYLE